MKKLTLVFGSYNIVDKFNVKTYKDLLDNLTKLQRLEIEFMSVSKELITKVIPASKALKRLYFWDCTFDDDKFRKCIPFLTELEDLELHRTKRLSDERLFQFTAKTLRKLVIGMRNEDFSDNSVLHLMNCSPNLEELTVTGMGSEYIAQLMFNCKNLRSIDIHYAFWLYLLDVEPLLE